MNRLTGWLLGEVQIRVSGASTQDMLNLLAKHGIPFWDILREDELNVSFRILRRDRKKMEPLALRAYCTAAAISEQGLPCLWKSARKRPCLLLGLLLSLFACFFLQGFVWVIEVQGTGQLHETQILRALEEEGVRFGTWTGDIHSQELKLKMLTKLPELSWLAVNRKGGKVTVLVSESEQRKAEENASAGHLVAAREGLITDYTVLEGMCLCARGETVQQGQLLVSGLEDYGLYLKAVRAQGEIYARTWRSGELICPEKQLQKVYTGREWTQVSLLAGNKRINLCGNSGILSATCDKMVSVREWKLPGYRFPLALEYATYREYTLKELPMEEESAKERLLFAWQNGLKEEMIAGSVESTLTELKQKDGCYILSAQSTCHEMIARRLPLLEVYEGENHERKTDQRGTH